VVSGFERQWLESEAPGSKGFYIPLMRDCAGRACAFEQREGICFIGGFLHKPNVDAVQYFLDQIWPGVHEKLPQCRFYIIGPDLPDDVARRTEANVEIVGHVPDLRAWMEKMRLSVAPLRYGAGAKGKVVTSLANGLPCVATDIASEGMGFVDNIHLAIENSPEAFTDRIIQLYQDKETWIKLSDGGHAYCAQEFSLDAGRERVIALFRALGLPIYQPSRNVD
jgi:glycosyltransferase involved in cell wall biosynthesis